GNHAKPLSGYPPRLQRNAGPRQLQRLGGRRARTHLGTDPRLLPSELELVENPLPEGGDHLRRARLDVGIRGVCLALSLDFAEACPALVLGDARVSFLGFFEGEAG